MAEGVRWLMDGIGGTLITAVVSLIVGRPLAYFIALERSRRERLEEKRAGVIAE